MGYLSFPNAKVNIGLNVTAKRPDGYHELESIFYPVNLSDAIEFIPTEKETSLAITGIGLPESDTRSNLIYKAWEVLHKGYNIPGYNIHLHKNIPIGAGLGGGSADAAFTLKALNNINDLGLSNSTLKKIAASLGSDCAFFIDNKPSYASGTGTELQPVLNYLKGYYLVLVCPNIFISTAEAYANIIPKASNNDLKNSVAKPVSYWKQEIKNDFEAYAFKKHPPLKEIKVMLYAKGALYASMSGSGSCIYGLFGEKPSNAFKTSFKNASVFISEL